MSNLTTAVNSIEKLKELFASTDGEPMQTLPFQGWEERVHPVTWAELPFDVITRESKTKFQDKEKTKPVVYKAMVAYLDNGEKVENISLVQASKIQPNGNGFIEITSFKPNEEKYPKFKVNKATIKNKIDEVTE